VFAKPVAAPSLPKLPSYAPPSAPSVTPTPQVAPPGGSAVSNYDVNTDPAYQAALAAINRGGGDIDSSLGKGLSSLLINYGSPALASQLSQYGYSANPNDAAAAQANYGAGNAILARLDQTHDLSRQGVVNTLAAHGLINSGDTGYKLGQADQDYGHNVYDATQNVHGQAYNLQQTALNQKASLQQQAQQALQAAWANFTANPGAYAQAPAAAPTPPPSDGGATPDYSYQGTPADLQQSVATPTPGPTPIYPKTNQVPYAVKVSSNKTGASANNKQGVFAIH
jgi:hypothetical protein